MERPSGDYALTVRFLSLGSSCQDHGVWDEDEEVDMLKLRFNARFPELTCLHPLELRRMPNSAWEGVDDKGGFVRLEHVASWAQFSRGWSQVPSL